MPEHTHTTPPKVLGYLIPEFPSQTHIWMWREIVHVREAGVPVRLFSTRRPGERDKARHAFAEGATAETFYIWPPGLMSIVAALLLAIFTNPIGLLRCIGLAFTMPLEGSKGGFKTLALIPAAAVLARRLRADGVGHLHCHTCANSAVMAMMAKRLTGIPFSMTLNANIEWWGGAMREKFEDAAFTIAITRWLLDDMTARFRTLLPAQRLLGRIGVDTRKWRRDRPLPPAPGHGSALRVITVGRLHASKGHDFLLRAVADLRSRLGPAVPVTLDVAGTGPEQSQLEALAVELGLAEHVRFLGSLSEDQLIDRLQEAHVFVLASHAEPLGVVYMEAMSLELPVIGTAAGGVGEIIDSGVDGLLVPPRDARLLADALEGLLADPDRRIALGSAARAKIIRCFDSRIGAATLLERLGFPVPSGFVPSAESSPQEALAR